MAAARDAHGILERLARRAGAAAKGRRLRVRSRFRACLDGGAAHHHSGGCFHGGNARHRASRQRRSHPRKGHRADHRLSDHGSGFDLAASERRPHGSGACARLRSGDRLRPGAGAGACRSAGAADRRVERGADRRPRGGGRRRRAFALGGSAHRRPARVRRLLGIRARRSDLHGAVAPQLGRHSTDRAHGQPPRHRLAAARAAGRRRRHRASQHGGADRPVEADHRRPRHLWPAQSPAAAVARPLCQRDRGPRGGRGAGQRRPGREGQAAHRRRGAGGRRHGGARARRPVPPHLVAWQCRRRGAAARLSRRTHVRAAHLVGRPQPVPQRTEPALSRYGTSRAWTPRPARAARLVPVVLAVLLALACASPGHAQSFPTRPIRLVVGFPPGGGVDVVARLFAEKLSAALGQSVVVENRPGASGSIAARQVAGADADGHTVLVNSNSMLVHQVMNPSAGLDIARDLKPVLSVAPQSIILVAAPDLPASSLAELMTLARAKKLLYGTPGVGSVPHLLAEYFFASLNGIVLEHVPYQGAAPALTAVMAGQIELASVTTPPAIALVKAGKIKGLAVTSAARAAALPDVPTIAESGHPGFVINVWTGFFMPAGAPKPALERFQAAALAIAAEPDMKDKLAALGFDTTTTPGETFSRELADETTRWSDVVTKAKLKM